MTADGDRSYVEPQTLSDVDTAVYEAVATLENSGRPATRAEIAAATVLDEAVLDESMQSLTERGVLVRSGSGADGRYGLGRRDWSAAPQAPAAPGKLPGDEDRR